MTKELHCYEYVNKPFPRVRDALLSDALAVLERATQEAAGRARFLVSTLKVSFAGLEVGKNIVLHTRYVAPHVEAPGHVAPDAIRFEIEWKAETGAAFFPSMRAELLAYALGPSETQLDLHGLYEPPGGAIGSAADWLVGHRVAQASVHRFLEEVSARISADLA
ncbi:MAG TPA: hypothetical protein VIF62_07950 [Labilithrix sp.]|jgi:hypothetical protein